jgi:hypothetical protein
LYRQLIPGAVGINSAAETRARGAETSRSPRIFILRLGKFENFRRVNGHLIVMQIRTRDGKFRSIAL